MALVDDVHVRWPDAVLPGSAAAQHFVAQRRAEGVDDSDRDARRGEEDPGR